MTARDPFGGFEAVTIDTAEAIEEEARQAVLNLAVKAANTHRLFEVTARGVLVGFLQIASLEVERGEIATMLRQTADNLDATARIS